MKVLLTGGTGYIGGHTCVEATTHGLDPVLVDNLSNSHENMVEHLSTITGVKPRLFKEDVRSYEGLKKVFDQEKIDAVIHFAGCKAVGESAENPLKYFDNNVQGTINLLKLMKEFDVKKLVFSSSATVYGKPETNPLVEGDPLNPESPYGLSKMQVEQILEQLALSDPSWSICSLRYFNPIGAHPSGLIGELPQGIPNNLIPYLCMVASGKLDKLNVFGGDYETRDGTGVRDYVHVQDLARGHCVALDYLASRSGFFTFNMGTGLGYSVLEIVDAFKSVTGIDIPYEITDRRPGDIAEYYASTELANKELGWAAEKSLEDMLASSWHWEQSRKA